MSSERHPQAQNDPPLISDVSTADLAPLPHLSTGYVDWDKIVSVMNVASRESRLATEKKSRRIAVLEEELRKLVDRNAGVAVEIERMDGQIREVLNREKRLHHLAAVARKRKARLQLELEEAEKKLATLAECDSLAKTASLTLVSPAVRVIAEENHKLEKDCIQNEKHEMAELQRKLYDAKARYRRICVENKKLMNALSSMKAEENEIISTRSENNGYNNHSNGESRIELETALQDLLKSLEEVIDAGRRRI